MVPKLDIYVRNNFGTDENMDICVGNNFGTDENMFPTPVLGTILGQMKISKHKQGAEEL